MQEEFVCGGKDMETGVLFVWGQNRNYKWLKKRQIAQDNTTTQLGWCQLKDIKRMSSVMQYKHI